MAKYNQPKDNTEYFLTYDTPDFSTWVMDQRRAERVFPKGTVVNNVTVDEHGKFSFTVMATGIRAYTHYPWALAEHTPENLRRFAEFLAAAAEADKYADIRGNAWREINSLQNWNEAEPKGESEQ